jgi:hypothetical protein
MQIRSVGIDLGKTTFHLVALGEHGKVHLSTALFTQIGIGTVRTCPAFSSLENPNLGNGRSTIPDGVSKKSALKAHRYERFRE